MNGRSQATRVLGALVALALAAPLAPAQSLAEVAAKEKERRKGQSAKAYTDNDLGGSGAAPEAPPQEGAGQPGDAPKPAAGQAKAEKTPDEQRAEDEKGWRDQLAQANRSVERLSAELTDLQARANATGDLIYTPQRAQVLQRIEQLNAELAAGRQRIDELEAQGRQRGYRR